MNKTDKAVINTLKYGTPNPSVFKRVFGGLFGNRQFIHSNNNQFWTAIYNYSKASKKELLTQGYAKNATVYSIVDLISRVASQAPWKVYKVKSASAYTRLKALQDQPYSQKRDLDISIVKEEALELYESHYLNTVLLNPNPQQSQAEYFQNLIGYKLVTGDSYMYADIDDKKKINSFWILPSDHIEITTDNYGTFPMHERGYILNAGGNQIPYNTNEVCHSKYWSPYFNGDGSHLYGFSPLDSAWLSILQDNTAKEASVEQLQNRGVRGIFSIENNQLTDATAIKTMYGHLHEDWQQNSKNYRDKIMPIFGRGQWHNVGSTIKDMAISEISKKTDLDIFRVFGINPILLGDNTSSTYDNYKTARKQLITDVVFPNLNMLRGAINRKLVPMGDWNNSKEKIVIDYDPTIYTELYEDVWDMGKKMREIGAYTDNEIRIATHYERLESPFMDDVWKRTNEVPISMISKENFNNNNNTLNNDRN